MKAAYFRSAARVAICYVLFGGVWMLGADRILDVVVTDPARKPHVLVALGWAFVTLSGALLYGLLRLELSRVARAEAAVEASRRHDQAFVEGALQGLCVQRDFVVLFANTAFAQLFGFDSAEATLGLDLRPFIAPEDLPRCEGYYRARMAGEAAPARYEIRARRRDGTPLWVGILVTAMPWEGRPAAFVAMVDVTETRRTEEELRHQREARAAAERLAVLGRLAAGVAHELRNPLTVILGRVGLLRKAATGSPKGVQEYVERQLPSLEEATERMQRIVDGLSNYSRPRPAVSPMAIAEVMANVRELLAYEARRSGVSIVTDIREALPRSGSNNHLVQIVLNLATNAIEAMAPQGRGQLVLRARTEGEQVVVEVADTGPGIPGEALERIWEPFYTTKPEGTGLGLSIVKSLVAEQPGAGISVDSEPGRGTTFRVTMPLAEST